MALLHRHWTTRTRGWAASRVRMLCGSAVAIAICSCAGVGPAPQHAPPPERPAPKSTGPAPTSPAPAERPPRTAGGEHPAPKPATAEPSAPAVAAAPATKLKTSATTGNAVFRFAEVPEIVFVRGFADRERLGIFQIDTGNRWTPGDLENSSGWKPRVATELEIRKGKLNGVSYDSATAELHYDGSGKG